MSNETKRDQKKNMQEEGKAGDDGTEREGEGGAGGGEQMCEHAYRSARRHLYGWNRYAIQILPVTRVCVEYCIPIPPMQVPTCRAIELCVLLPLEYLLWAKLRDYANSRVNLAKS